MDRNKLEQNHAETWINRSIALAGMAYPDYLKSDDWKRIRKLAKTREHYKKCYVCERRDLCLEIHHRSYKWIGTKYSMRGLVSLCRGCHQSVHDLAKKHNISVRQATRRARRLYWNPKDNRGI